VSTPPSKEPEYRAPIDRTTRIWRQHWQDEIDAQHLYRRLAESSPDREKRSLYRKFADVERQHIAIWEQIFAEHAIAAGARRPSLRARVLAGIARIFGARDSLVAYYPTAGHDFPDETRWRAYHFLDWWLKGRKVPVP